MNTNKSSKNRGYVKLFFTYSFKVLWRAITTIAFLIVDAFGLVLIFFNLDQPKIPLILSLIVFGITIIISAYLTWRDELIEVNRLNRKLKEIRNNIPNYNVEVKILNNYSISKRVSYIETQLDHAKQIVDREKEQNQYLTPVADALQSLKRINFRFPYMGKVESSTEKVERLEDFLHQLVQYNERIKHTYKIGLSFEASKSDENIEFKVEVSDGANLFVEDNYISNNFPKTREPTFMEGLDYDIASLRGISNPNSSYPYSFSEDGIGFSKMTKINAQRTYNIFDEDVYVESKANEITATITIHSTKTNNPQIITKVLNFKNIDTREVQEA